MLKMNLQMFAEQTDSQADETVTLTTKELQSKLDAEAEKRVAKVTAKKEAEFQEQLKQAREEAKNEGMSYGQMTEKQKQEAEEKAQREAFETEREQFYREKLTLDVSKDLRDKGLPESFADVLVLAGDKEVIATKVTELKTELDAWIAEQLRVNARQDTPNETGGFTGATKSAPNIRDFANKNRIIKGD